MTLRDQIVAEIMSLVRQPPRKMERPSIAELEKILNSESTDDINIEPDGSISVTPTVTTVVAVADKVVAVVEAEISRLRTALVPFADYGAGTGRKVSGDMQVSAGSSMAKRQIIMRDCHEAADALGLK